MNEGHIYEEEIRGLLSKKGVLDTSYQHVTGSSYDHDLAILYNGKRVIVELKYFISKADFGQINLKYDKSWKVSTTSKNEKFANILKYSGLEAAVNRQWGKHGPPFASIFKPAQRTQSNVDYDFNTFAEFTWDAPQNLIENYYKNKGVSYVQIKGLGFYKLSGAPNLIPLKIPIFKPTVKMRIRVKKSGGGKGLYYDFNAAIVAEARGMSKSPYDLDINSDFLLKGK